MSALRFRKPGFWPTLATAAGIAAALALGNWQLGRGHDKTVLAQRTQAATRDPPIALPAAEIGAEDVSWRRVEAQGTFAPEYTILIDNRMLRGAVGYHVVTPLRIADSGRYVLVNRGWIAGTNTRDHLPEIRTPAGVVRVSGLATVPAARYFELSGEVAGGKVWQNLTLDRYRAAFPLTIQPVVIRQENDTGDGLRREWDAPDLGVEKHYGYAFQWFALAATILIFYLVAHVRKQT